MAQKLMTVCDFCLSEDAKVPNGGKYQAEITAEGTTLVADLCDTHMGMLASGFHPRRGRAPAWLLTLQGKEEPKQKRKYTKRQPEAETPEEPGAEPEDDEAEGDDQQDEEDVQEDAPEDAELISA